MVHKRVQFCKWITILVLLIRISQAENIRGIIVDEFNKPLSNVSVTLVNKIPEKSFGGYDGDYITLTGEDGSFSFGTEGVLFHPKNMLTPLSISNGALQVVPLASDATVTIHSLQGRLLEKLEVKKSDRVQSVSLLSLGRAAQIFVIQIKNEQLNYTFLFSPNSSTVTTQIIEQTTEKGTRSYVADTVTIVANGYKVKRIPIQNVDIDLGKINLEPIELTCTGQDKTPSKTGAFYYDKIDVNGEERDFGVHIPSDYDKSKKYALILCYHGRGATAEDDHLVGFGGFIEGAGEEAIILFPEARYSSDSFWSYSWKVMAHQGNIDFTDALVQFALENFNIDTDRIYAAGFSLGGQMSTAVRAYRGGSVFKGVATICGWEAYNYNMFNCSVGDVSTPIATAIITGNEEVSEGDYNRAVDVLKVMKGVNGATGSGATVDIPEGSQSQMIASEFTLYTEGCEKYPILFGTNDANHWSPPPIGKAIWKFFTEYVE